MWLHSAAMCEKRVDCSSAGMIAAWIAHYNWRKDFLEMKSSKKLENATGLTARPILACTAVCFDGKYSSSDQLIFCKTFTVPNENVSQSFSIIGSAKLAKKPSLRQHRRSLPTFITQYFSILHFFNRQNLSPSAD